MKKKILSLVLTLCMLLGMFPFVVGTSALAVSETDGKVHLTTAEDLLALMGDTSLWNKDIVLENDIDMTGKTGQTPIGNAATPFTGNFVGNGHTVSGLNLSGTDNVGFFGVARNATIENLTLKGTITATGSYVGGFVGYADLSAGDFTLTNCKNYVDVSATGTAVRVAGFIGWRTRPAIQR